MAKPELGVPVYYEDIEKRLLDEADDTRSEDREKLLREAADVIHRLRADLIGRIRREQGYSYPTSNTLNSR